MSKRITVTTVVSVVTIEDNTNYLLEGEIEDDLTEDFLAARIAAWYNNGTMYLPDILGENRVKYHVQVSIDKE